MPLPPSHALSHNPRVWLALAILIPLFYLGYFFLDPPSRAFVVYETVVAMVGIPLALFLLFRRQRGQWQHLGESLGLTPEETGGKRLVWTGTAPLTGAFEGFPVRVDFAQGHLVHRGRRESWTGGLWTFVELRYGRKGDDLEFRVFPRTLGRRILRRRAVGLRIGDPAFDRLFQVETSQPERARRVLDADTRSWILAPQRRDGHLFVEQGVIQFVSRNMPSEAQLRERLEFLVRTAKGLRPRP